MDNRFIKTLLRLFRLMFMFGKMDLMFITRDPGTLVVWAITDTVLNLAAVSGMLLLAARFGGIGIWSQAQFVFMLGYGCVVEGLINLFFGYNVSHISRRVGRGQLDHSLIQPQPLWLCLLTEGFSPAFGLPTLIPGALLLAWSIPHLPGSLDLVWAARMIVSIAASVVIVMSFQFSWGSLAFYAPRSAEEINMATNQLLTGLKSFPLDGFNPFLRVALLTVLPVGLSAWAPAAALLGVGRSIVSTEQMVIIAIVFAAAATMLFWRGFRHYLRTGSQRYSPFGHRS